MIPDIPVLAWVLHAACAVLAGYFGFWLVRAEPSDGTVDGDAVVGAFRTSRFLAFALLLCSVGSGATLFGFGEGWPILWVSAVGAGLVGVAVGFVDMWRQRR